MLVPVATLSVCPVESLLKVNADFASTERVTVDNLDACLQKLVLSHESLATLKRDVLCEKSMRPC